jgi:hypothetical protein
VPDTRGFIAIGLFALTFFLFALIAFNPNLANVQLFGVLATAVISGGFGGMLGFYYGSSRSSSDKDATIAAQVNKDRVK